MPPQRTSKQTNPYLHPSERDRKPAGQADREGMRGASSLRPKVRQAQGGRSKRRSSHNTCYVVWSVLMVLVIGAILTFTVFFNVNEVVIQGETRYTKLQITSAGDINIGDNLFFTAGRQSVQEITTKLPYLYKVEVERKFPATLILTVSDTPAFFALRMGEEYVLLDGRLKVLEKVAQLPEQIILLEGKAPLSANIGYEAELEPLEEFSQEEGEEPLQVESAKELIGRIVEAVVVERFSGLTKVDISDSLNIRLTYQDRLVLIMGAPTELEYKLRFAKKSIEKLEENAEGYINLSVPKNAFYSPNNSKVGENFRY